MGGVVLTLLGLGWGLFLSPADWQQSDAARIIYIHVPAAWLASAGYFGLAACAVLSLIWRHPLADMAAAEIGPVGAGATALCLATGSLWGKPMWGAWWVWDARLTSMIGAVDLPVIKFSVEWWNTLHQPATFKFTSAPTMYQGMIWPLLISAAGFSIGFAAIVTARLRAAVMERRIRGLMMARAQETV